MYYEMKEQIKSIAKGDFSKFSVNQMLDRLLHRKVGERPIRYCTPLRKGNIDEVPSPVAKKYEKTSKDMQQDSEKLPRINVNSGSKFSINEGLASFIEVH